MSEVKGARELASDIKSAPISMMLCSTGETTYPAAELILSDRRTIIEKCKEAIGKVCLCISYKDMQDLNSVFDSVLSDLEKEE